MLTVLKAIKRWLRLTPSVREAHRRYQLHLQRGGARGDFVAAGLTATEYNALCIVLDSSPSAKDDIYDVGSAIESLCTKHDLCSDMSHEERSVRHEVLGLLERWQKQEEAAKYRLNMPPGVQHPFFGSTTGYTQF